MARDEALLVSCIHPDSMPVLRFYRWSPATISLGYFQGIEEFEALPSPAGALDIVRRTTGGGAILHDLEVTYSLTIPIAHPLVAGKPNELYTLAHQAIIAAIGEPTRQFGCGESACSASPHRGPFFCFARRHALDVVIPDDTDEKGTRKLAGSAQRRTPTAILQHGSIMLGSRFDQQPLASWSEIDCKKSGESRTGIDLADAEIGSVNATISFETAVKRLVETFSSTLNFKFEISNWASEEIALAAKYQERYAGKAWTHERKREPI